MEFIKNDIAELEANLIVKVEENDYKEAVEKELKKVRKTANIKGYRPGHVPPQVISKLFGKDIVAQEVSKMLDDKLKEYFEKEKIETIGDILPIVDETKFDVEKDKDFQFGFNFGIFPEVKIDVENLKVPVYKLKITDEQIDEEVVNLQKKYGDFSEGEIIEEKSRFRADFVELNDDKTPKEDGVKVEDGLVLVEFIDKDTAKEVTGAKKGDKFVIEIKKAFKNETDLSSLLNIEKEKLAEIGENFEITIKLIENYKEGELNQEFFDKLFGKDAVKSVDEMKAKIREITEQQYENETKVRFRQDMRNVLKDNMDMPLPEGFIVKWQLDRRKDATEEDIKKEMDELKDAIKWDRVLNVLSKEYNLQIEQKDLLDASKANIINAIAQMGMSVDMFSEEQLDQFASQELDKMKDNDRYSLIFATVERKVLDGLFDKVIKEEKEITIDELKAIYEEENKKIADNDKKEEENKEEKPVEKTEE